LQQGLSFKREPDSRFQEISLGQSDVRQGQSNLSVPASSASQNVMGQAAGTSASGVGLSDKGKLSRSFYKPGDSVMQTGLYQSQSQYRDLSQPYPRDSAQNR